MNSTCISNMESESGWIFLVLEMAVAKMKAADLLR